MDFIIRQQATSDELPPWAGIVFKHPVDSDALSENLRNAYPECRTLRERKHRATIDFFEEELTRMRSRNSISLVSTDVSGIPSLEPQSDAPKGCRDIVSGRSRQSSTSDCTSPSLEESFSSPQLVERIRRGSRATINPEQSQPMTPSPSAQQFVWSAHDGRSMRPKTKRKMTVEERSAYKETRKRGACDKCRRQKGRCTHMTDADYQLSMVDTNEPKKRGATSLDVLSPESFKSIKTEHTSDIHYNTLSDTRQFGCAPVNAQISPEPNEVMRPLDLTTESVPDGGRQRERRRVTTPPTKYVFSEYELEPFGVPTDQDQEPWSSYTTRDPTESIQSGYVLEANMPTDPMSSLRINRQPHFSFQSAYAFYQGPWMNSQDQPNGTPSPT